MTREESCEFSVPTNALGFAAPLHAIESVSVERCEGKLRVHATKEIKATDPYMAGHFPGFVIFPGVFIIESLRQLVVTALGDLEGILPEILTLRSVRFLAPVLPGDSISLDAAIGPVPDRKSFEIEAFCRRSDGVTAAVLKVEFGYGAIANT
jgi:3-hydroxyacyl-[acyl-carrier-protein] dehydratase